MWTNNGKKLFLARLLNPTLRTQSFIFTNGDINTLVPNSPNGIVSYSYMNNIKSVANYTHDSIATLPYLGVFCGSGDTEPTVEDITLAQPLSLDYTAGNITETIINKVIQYTVRNNNTETITIKELGLFNCGITTNGTAVLLNRKLLDTPITLEVGEQAVITFTVDTSNILDGEGWVDNFKILACNNFLDNTNNGTYKNVLNKEALSSSSNGVGGITTSTIYNSANSITSAVSSSNRYKYSIYCGQGTTPYTTSDYTLEAPVDLTCQGTSITFDDNYNGLISFTLQNTSTDTYTITETALVAGINTSGNFVMFNRKLLPTPVVMEPNDSYVFTYNINVSNLSE